MPVGWAIAIVVLWAAVLVMAVILLGVLRQITPLLERAAAQSADHAPLIQGPQIGEQVPHFSACDTDGEVVDDQGLRGRAALLLFLSVGCEPCAKLAAEIRTAADANDPDLAALASQLIIVTGPDGPATLGIPPGLRTVTQSSDEIARALAVGGFPFAVAIDPAGIVKAARVPNALDHLTDLSAVLV